MRHWDLPPSVDVSIQTCAGRFAGAINYHAAPPVIAHCFTRLNAHRIEARIEPENLSSRRLAAKLRFTEEGLLRDWLCVAGEFRAS